MITKKNDKKNKQLNGAKSNESIIKNKNISSETQIPKNKQQNKSTEKSLKTSNSNINNNIEKNINTKINKIKDNNSILKKSPSNRSIISEEIMKEMLKGEDHIEHNSVSNIGMDGNISNKEVIIVRPRESYLKEKINTMKNNFSQTLLSNINKELFSQINTIKKELSDNDIHITEVPKNLNKYLPKSKGNNKNVSFSSLPNIFFPVLNKNNNDEYSMKKNYKDLRKLREEQNMLKKNLIQICENEKLLEKESTLNYSKNYVNKFKIDANLKIQQLKSMKIQKENIKEKIKILDSKINNLISNDKSLQNSKNEILKNFIQNFNRDKEIAEIRAQNYLEESKRLKKRIKNDIKSLKEKRIKEIQLKEKGAEKQKEEILSKFKEKQKAIQLKQSKENEKIMLQYKPYVREKPENNINSYIFKIKEKKYLLNEEKLLRNENLRRKEYLKSINIKELKEFAESFDEKKAKNEEENKLKKIKLLNEWKERKSFLPSYKSQSFEIYNSDIKEKKEINDNQKEEKDNLMKLKKEYSEIIKEQFSPIIDKKLYNKRMDLIKELEMPASEKYKVKKNYFVEKKKRIVFKKIDLSKPSKLKWKLKLEENSFDKMNNSDMDMRYLIKRPKKISMYSGHNKIKSFQKINEHNNISNENKKSKNELTDKKIGQNKLEKNYENHKKNIYENISNMKKEADNLNKKVIKGEQLLRVGGCTKNNVELGQKVLLIDSIQAKLNILNHLGK